MKQYKYKITSEWVEEKDLEENTIYVLRNAKGNITNVFFKCPCDKKDYIMLPIFPEDSGIGWNIKIKNNEVTLRPSVFRGKCKAHFLIKNSRVIWC
jgi:hypothetical protein